MIPGQRVSPGARTVTATLQLQDDPIRVVVVGVFDAQTAFVLSAALRSACATGSDVVVDLARARLTDSASHRPLYDAAQRLAASAHRLEILTTSRKAEPWTG